MKSFQPYTVPSDDWFVFDSHPGKERLHVVLSKDPIPLLPGFREPVTTRASVDRKVVEEVSRGIQSRDLLIESASEAGSRAGAWIETVTATYIINPSQDSQTVGVTIELVHGE